MFGRKYRRRKATIGFLARDWADAERDGRVGDVRRYSEALHGMPTRYQRRATRTLVAARKQS